MPSNLGNQQVTVKYFDPVDSDVANRIGLGVRKPGIYSGGYVTRVSDVSATISALDCEIGDGTYQVRIQTGVGGSGNLAVTGIGAGTPYIILRWTYTGSITADYLEALAVAFGSITANDVIVCKCTFPGGTLTPGYGWDITDKIITRTNPNVQDLFLKVEPTVPASLYVRIRGGRVSYGTANYDIGDQTIVVTVPPANSWITLIQVNTSGAIIASAIGSAAASPTAPVYGGLITLAEVTTTAGGSTVSASNIKDVRGFVSGGASINNLLPSQSGNAGKYLTTDASNISWGTVNAVPSGLISLWSGSIASIPSGWYLCNGSNGTPDLRDKFIVGAGSTYAVAASGGAITHTHTVPATQQIWGITPGHGGGGYIITMAANENAQRATVDASVSTGSSLPPYYALAYIMKA